LIGVGKGIGSISGKDTGSEGDVRRPAEKKMKTVGESSLLQVHKEVQHRWGKKKSGLAFDPRKKIHRKGEGF